MTRIEKLKYARAVLLTQDRIALRYQKLIKRELKKTANQLAKSYEINQNDSQFAEIQAQHKTRMTEILTDLSKETSERFKAFKLTGKKNIFDNFVENSIYSILASNVLTTATTVSSNTVATASAVIMQTMANAVTNPIAAEPENVANAIANRIGGQNSVSRAMTIARTETHKAANVSQYTRAESAATDSGLDVVVEWISTNDGRVRDSHKNANGQTRPMGQPFNVGGESMKYPSDPTASAANVINCRCVLGYDTK